MWNLVRKIFSNRDGEVTVVVLDDDEPDKSRSFRLQSADVIRVAVITLAVAVLLTTLIFFVTPLGSLYQQQQDEGLRQEVLSITERIVALQDSLELRDRQLLDLRRILVEVPDTVFFSSVSGSGRSDMPVPFPPVSGSGDTPPAYEMLNRDDLVRANVGRTVPMFPARYPLEGSVTQGFSVGDGHYGIDIAARSGTEFRAIAEGTVVYAGWSVNYGYVIYLQHSEGYMSIYKHGASLFRKTGDVVLRGDLLGTVGDRGALSFGSHLHLEIWKDGVAQPPETYLIK